MTRLLAFLSALVIALVGVWLVFHGVESVLLYFQAHPLPNWFGRTVAVFVSIFVSCLPIVIVTIRRRRTPPDEDGPLTPRVRRRPSGLRDL